MRSVFALSAIAASHWTKRGSELNIVAREEGEGERKKLAKYWRNGPSQKAFPPGNCSVIREWACKMGLWKQVLRHSNWWYKKINRTNERGKKGEVEKQQQLYFYEIFVFTQPRTIAHIWANDEDKETIKISSWKFPTQLLKANLKLFLLSSLSLSLVEFGVMNKNSKDTLSRTHRLPHKDRCTQKKLGTKKANERKNTQCQQKLNNDNEWMLEIERNK